MPLFDVELSDGRIVTVESQNEPTEQQVLSSLNTPQQQNESFTKAQIPEFESSIQKPSGLNPLQNIILGFAPNDEARLRYLQEQFEGKNVELDPDRGLLVNGARVNPKGFDFGDVLRNLGYALPFAGQVIGGTAGAPAGPVGVAVGGIRGALTGESARLGFGKLFGVDPTLAEATGALAKEGILATGGELASAAIKPIARGLKIDKGLEKFWNKTLGKLSKLEKPVKENIAQYVGGVSPNHVRTSSKYDFQNLTEKYFDENRASKILSKQLFGNEELSPVQRISRDNFGIQKGAKSLAETIRKTNSPEFDNYVKHFMGLSDEAVDTIKTNQQMNLFNPRVMSESYPKEVANSIKNMAKKEIQTLGKEIGKKANKSTKYTPFATDDMARNLEQMMRREGIIGGIQVPGFRKLKLPDIKGKKELMAIRNLLGSEIAERKGVPAEDVGKFVFFGAATPSGRLTNTLTKGQAIKVRNSMEQLVDNVFNSGTVSDNTKRVLAEFMTEFRERFGKSFDLIDENRMYSSFKDLVNEAKINSGDAEKRLFSLVQKWRARNPLEKERVESVLSQIAKNRKKPELANQMLNKIKKATTIDELRNYDIEKQFTKLESIANSNNLIDPTVNAGDEAILRNFDRLFRNSNSNILRNKTIVEELEKSIAAKGFKASAPNMLRVGAVANMLGAGAIGTKLFGPAGGLASAAFSLSLSNPETIARLLRRSAERKAAKSIGQKATGQGLKKAQSFGKNIQGASVTELLRQLAER